MWRKKTEMVAQDRALPGRESPITVSGKHYVNGNRMLLPVAEGLHLAMFGMGCFWGAERKFWLLPGVVATAAGYAAGFTPNPSYEEVCSGLTGHNEVVMVVYDPSKVSYAQLLATFWESHDPTQGMAQGNDQGTQYRSGIYTYDETQLAEALASKADFQMRLQAAGYKAITTEVIAAPEFYFAEEYHQQYLAKNPGGYCGLGGTGVSCS